MSRGLDSSCCFCAARIFADTDTDRRGVASKPDVIAGRSTASMLVAIPLGRGYVLFVDADARVLIVLVGSTEQRLAVVVGNIGKDWLDLCVVRACPVYGVGVAAALLERSRWRCLDVCVAVGSSSRRPASTPRCSDSHSSIGLLSTRFLLSLSFASVVLRFLLYLIRVSHELQTVQTLQTLQHFIKTNYPYVVWHICYFIQNSNLVRDYIRACNNPATDCAISHHYKGKKHKNNINQLQ